MGCIISTKSKVKYHSQTYEEDTSLRDPVQDSRSVVPKNLSEIPKGGSYDYKIGGIDYKIIVAFISTPNQSHTLRQVI